MNLNKMMKDKQFKKIEEIFKSVKDSKNFILSISEEIKKLIKQVV